ncbi:MAG: hypothetical protein PHH14_03190 [Candidatus Margulisbacteria bacterium]|nr:hypothetical protein [Candidatus Margulisiibacteriota bacterium]
MDDNFGWKTVYIATVFSLVVLGFAYWLISPRDANYFSEEKIDKIAEFTKTSIAGRKDGKKSWEFYARSGWASKSKNITYLYNVTKGTIFKDGKPFVSALAAPTVEVYRQAERIEARSIKARLDIGRVTADRAVINIKAKTVHLYGHPLITRPDRTISADEFEYLSNDERFNAAGRVAMKIKENNIVTRVNCEQAVFFTDQGKEITLRGSVEALQGKKAAIARHGVYSKQANGLRLSGETRTIMEKAGAFIKPETLKQLTDPEEKALLRQKTVIAADEIFFSTKSGDAQASGSVEVTQKGRVARSARAVYNDRDESITLTGNVYLKKGEEWISCREVIVSVKDETFEAIGVTEARFKI